MTGGYLGHVKKQSIDMKKKNQFHQMVFMGANDLTENESVIPGGNRRHQQN